MRATMNAALGRAGRLGGNLNRWEGAMSRWMLCALCVWLTGISAALAQQTTSTELRAVPAPTSTGSTSSPQAGSGQAGSGQARQVVIDGKLDDWDLSGGIFMCYDVQTLYDLNSVRAYLMYDAQFLYAAFQFKDRTPMMNHVDPRLEPGCGWRSDCVQLRIFTDRVIHMDGYYFTDKQEPVMRLAYVDIEALRQGNAKADEGALDDTLQRGAQEAFLKDPDGKGYTQELRIPWALLRRDGQAYKAGDSFRMGIECFWGDGSAYKWYNQRLVDLINVDHPIREFFWQNKAAWGKVTLLAKGHLPPAEQSASFALAPSERLLALKYSTKGPVKIEYKIPGDGYATLVVEKPDGTRVRNLFSDYPRKKGKNVDYWDGTDDNGQIAEPGSYRVRGLWHPELDALYQFAYSCPGTPVWETPDGTGGWISDYNSCSVVSDGQTQFITGAYFDCGVGTIALSNEGRKLWGIRQPELLREPAAAVDGQYLYLASGQEAGFGYTEKGLKTVPDDKLLLQRLDKKTGKPVSFEGSTRSCVELGTVKAQTGLPYESYGELVEKHLFNADILMARVQGLAVGNGAIYVSSSYEDTVLVADVKTGKITDRLAVPHPAGLALDGAGGLLVVNAKDRQVVRVDLKTKAIAPIVTANLEAPLALTRDAAGNLYVSDWGQAMCVKVFAPDGKFLRTIGKPGGRPWVGTYDVNGMLLPYGIAVDGQNRLWTVEFDGCPRRISVWKTEGGFVREFISAHSYAGGNCWINPNQPERAIAQNAEFELNWKTGQYRTLATVWRPTRSNEFFGPYPDLMLESQKEVTVKGRKFLVSDVGCVVISERKGDRYQPLTAFGNMGSLVTTTLNLHGQTFSGLRLLSVPQIFRDHLYWSPKLNAYLKEHYPEFFNGNFGNNAYVLALNILDYFDATGVRQEFKTYPWRSPTTNFIWSDRNGDGLVQPDELTFFEAPGVEPTGMGSADVTDDLTLYASSSDRHYMVWRMSVAGWTACGAPTYDPAQAQLIVNEKNAAENLSEWADSRGNLLSSAGPTMRMFSPDGKALWHYPNPYPGVQGSHKSPKGERGMLIGPLKVIGSAQVKSIGEVYCMNGNFGQAFFMTADGLYVGSLFRDARSAPDDMPTTAVRGASHRETTMNGEWFGGQFFRNPRDGKLYLAGEHHSAGGTCIYELTGLDQVRRLPEKTILFDAKAAEASRQMLEEANRAKLKGGNIATTEIAIQRMLTPPTLDGVGSEYATNGNACALFTADDEHSAVASVAYDDTNLYLFVQVKDTNPLQNLGKFGQYELYKSGDCVLFELGAKRPVHDLSPKPVEGDLRLLLSKVNGVNTAVLYRYVVPGAPNPVSITSGLGTLKIDDGRVLTDVKMATAQTAGGYTLEAAIPLATLGFAPKPGTKYRGDFGVIYSDSAGAKNTLRMHWATRNIGLISDSSYEGKIQPDQWGTIVVPEAK